MNRFGTISHILASTELNCCTKKEDVLSDEALIEKNAVEIVKQMQKLRGIDGEYDSDSASSNRLAHRKYVLVRFSGMACDILTVPGRSRTLNGTVRRRERSGR